MENSHFGWTDLRGAGQVPRGFHHLINKHYSSVPPFTNGLTVRDWLATQSFEAQRQYGLDYVKFLWNNTT